MIPSMILPEEIKEEINKTLNERGAKLPCPRCGNNHFSLIDGYFNNTIQNDLQNTYVGGNFIPSVIFVCSKCGFMSQHALGALGLNGLNEM